MKTDEERSSWRPVLAAEWLQLRAHAHRTHWGLVCIALSVAVGALLALRRVVRTRDVFAVMDAHWPIVLALVTLYAAAHVARRRRRLLTHSRRLWLIATPVPAASLQMTFAGRVLAPIAGAMLVITLSVMVLAFDARGMSPAIRVITCLWAGALLGAFVGWMGSTRRRQPTYEASRYVPHRAQPLSLTASSAALSQWALAQAFAWGRPENLRTLVVLCLLLGVQAGSSALQGLLIVASWILAGYLGSLLFAVPRTARAAAQWLRSTPIVFGQFAWAILRRVLVHQAIGLVLAALAMSVLGASASVVLYICTLWICVLALVFVIGVADAWRGRSPAMKIALSLATMAAVESRAHAWSIPAVLVLVAWRFRSSKT